MLPGLCPELGSVGEEKVILVISPCRTWSKSLIFYSPKHTIQIEMILDSLLFPFLKLVWMIKSFL